MVSLLIMMHEVILCQLIEHQSRLRRVDCFIFGGFKYTGTGSFIPLLLGLSSLEELMLQSFQSNLNTELLPHSNTNLKKLTISSELIQPLALATLLPNITSLTYLEIFGSCSNRQWHICPHYHCKVTSHTRSARYSIRIIKVASL